MRRKLLLGAWGLLAIVLAGMLVGFMMEKQVTVTFNDGTEELSIKTRKSTLDEALTAADIEIELLKKQYRPSVPWNEPLEGDLHVTMTRIYNVTLKVDGEEKELKTEQQTIENFLQEQHVDLGELDEVNVPLDSPVRDDMTVVVDRIEEKVTKKEVTLPFETVKKEDSNLEKGKQVVAQEGKPGKQTIEVTSTYKNGTLIEREEVVIKEQKPTNKIVKIGTKPQPKQDNKIRNTKKKSNGVQLASREQSSSGGTIAGRAYSKVLNATATAYTGDTITYTGVKPKRGTVAVDPSVIPLGTRLYIPGYGFGVAQDTGGAIKGNKIDVFVDSRAEALNWGIRPVKVYILK